MTKHTMRMVQRAEWNSLDAVIRAYRGYTITKTYSTGRLSSMAYEVDKGDYYTGAGEEFATLRAAKAWIDKREDPR